MSWMFRSVVVGIIAITAVLVYNKLFEVNILPPLEEKWWGSGPVTNQPPKITTKPIDFPQSALDDLNFRLHHTKSFYPSLEGVKQYYGIHNTVLQNVFEYWKNQYNWTERLRFLNQYSHNFVQIRGLDVHFLHIKPNLTQGQNVKVLPLMMVHGWLSTFREFYEVIPSLTQPQKGKNFVFELIIPSLPGFAFSEATRKPGLSPAYMAQIFKELMDIVGFDRYYVYGGDWGSSVVTHLTARYPEKIIGMHSTLCLNWSPLAHLMFVIGHFWPSLIYEENEVQLSYNKQNTLMFVLEETGYFHIQGTKPDTVGVALRESPMGLAGYILEKVITVTNPYFRDREDGALTEKYTMEQILDNIMIYWLTESITSSMRIYAEALANFELEFMILQKVHIYTPAGCARFPYELSLTPRSILTKRLKNLVHLTQYDTGGHFAALEEPDLFANDLYLFAEKVENIKKSD
ncbi:juvenile hormone epoxide hydrolase 1-like [Euwallacea fornicatus]|uniref:juvenile hormone epoxide hydrolase 1-like n=1 Tax=Euwallacea fornicatus TaxID=995702 RepID=UPI00338E95A0